MLNLFPHLSKVDAEMLVLKQILKLTATPTHAGSQGSLYIACSLCKVQDDMVGGEFRMTK